MRLLIISDIHANVEALEAVLAAPAAADYDRLLVLGDLVGYGADPNEVVDRIYDLAPDVLIRGNHDKVASGVEEPEHFNAIAAETVRWTRETLTDANRMRVASLPQGPVHVDDEIQVCHGTPYDEDAYVFDYDDAQRALAAADRRVCLFGHTHVPVVFSGAHPNLGLDVVTPELGASEPTCVRLNPDHRYLINPGAVGQPRDGDPRAAFGVYETDDALVEIHRVPYRVDLAQERIEAAGLPLRISRRLGVGR